MVQPIRVRPSTSRTASAVAHWGQNFGPFGTFTLLDPGQGQHEAAAQFRAFEHQAAKIMARYDGGIAYVAVFLQQDFRASN